MSCARVGAAADSPSVRRVIVLRDPAVEELPVEFTGSAREYFRIWIVNLGLTVVTLGIYSAWAKVRTTRYLYGSTRVAGASFDYLANPLAILKGRLIAVGYFVAYSLAAQFHAVMAAVLGAVFFLAIPWVIVRSLAFRTHNTAYRNVRFGFCGRYGQAALVFVLEPLIAVVTLGLYYPAARCHQQHFVIDNARFGTTPFRFGATSNAFYGIYVRSFLLAVLLAATATAVTAEVPLLGIVAALLFALYVYYYVQSAVVNLMYDDTTLVDVRFQSTLTPWPLLLLRVSNTVAVMLSLGLLIPWARIRMARYRASCLTLTAVGGLDGFVAAQEAEPPATGEEVGEMFDIDIGF